MILFLQMLWADARTGVPMWIAFHLVPRAVAYWCAVRVITHAAKVLPDAEVNAITPSDALKAWGQSVE